jgi:hypothetical protein
LTLTAMNRHATASYKEREVDVTVSPLPLGSYLELVVHDPSHHVADLRVDYIVDATSFDEAVELGVKFARELIDGRLH